MPRIEAATGDRAGIWILAAGAFLLLGMRQTFTVPLTFGLSPGQFLLYIGVALWLSVGVRSRPVAVNRALVIGLCGYLVATLVSYGSAMNRGGATQGFVSGDRYLFAELAMTVMAIVVVITVTTTARTELMLKGLLLGGMVSSVFAIVKQVTGADLAPLFILPGLKANDFVLVATLSREGIDRPQGSAGHPLELAGVLTVLVPLGLAIVSNARRRGDRVWPWAACTVLLVSGALVTVSRSVMIGLAAAVLIMAWRWSIARFAAMLFTALAGVGLGFLMNVSVFNAILASFLNASTDSSIASRSFGAAYVAAHFRDHLWFGQGAGMYPSKGQPVLDNQYLTRLMETGVCGLVSFAALIGIALVLALRASAASDSDVAELAGGVSGSLAALATISLILDISGFVQIWTVAWLLVALSAVLWQLSRQAPAR